MNSQYIINLYCRICDQKKGVSKSGRTSFNNTSTLPSSPLNLRVVVLQFLSPKSHLLDKFTIFTSLQERKLQIFATFTPVKTKCPLKIGSYKMKFPFKMVLFQGKMLIFGGRYSYESWLFVVRSGEMRCSHHANTCPPLLFLGGLIRSGPGEGNEKVFQASIFRCFCC